MWREGNANAGGGTSTWGWGNHKQPLATLKMLLQVLLGAFGIARAGGPRDGAMPLQRLHRTFCKATVSLSAGGDAGTCVCCSPAVFPVPRSSRSSSLQRCWSRGCRGAVTRAPAELQHSRGTAFICCGSFATDSLAELTANCNLKLSDGSFFQPGSVRNKFVWVIKTY